MKRKAIWWLRVGLLALAGASGCVRCTVASKDSCPCQCQAPRRAARHPGECATPCSSCTPYLSCATDKPAAPPAPASTASAAKAPATATATAASPTAKPMQLPPLPTPTTRVPSAPPAGTVPLPELKPTSAAKPKSLPEVTSAPAKPAGPAAAAPAPVIVTGPTAAAKATASPAPAAPGAAAPVASRPKVRLILTGTVAAPAKPAAPATAAVGPQMPSQLPNLDLPAQAAGQPAARANVKDEEGPYLFPDEPARPAGVELAVAKGLEGPGRAVHAYLPAQAKPDVPALQPVPAVVPTVLPASAGPKAPARPLQLPDPPPETRRVFPTAEPGPVRRSFSDVTAAPCFAHGADYGWLCGRVEYSRLSKGWRLRYASVDEDDRFGGSVTLAPDPKLDALKDGQCVRVTGHLADRPPGLSPEYQVESITPVKHPNAPPEGDSEPGEF